MSVATETARLRRAVVAFVAGVEMDLRGRSGLAASDRNALRAEIEECTQLLDELRSKLSG